MLDPVVIIMTVGAVSGAGAVGAGAMALRHHVDIVRARRDPLTEVLEHAFPLDNQIPDSFRALLDRIDGRNA